MIFDQKKYLISILISTVVTSVACAVTSPLFTMPENKLSETCSEWARACHEAVYQFEIELFANHLHCTIDEECIADKIEVVSGLCCYASRRDWWESLEKGKLLNKALTICGSRGLTCPRHRCRSICLDGRCTSIFDVMPSKKVETIDN